MISTIVRTTTVVGVSSVVRDTKECGWVEKGMGEETVCENNSSGY